MKSATTIYLESLERELRSGIAREHAYRPALKSLLESLRPGIDAVNDPERVTCGAPDLRVLDGSNLLLGYVETKDLGDSLDEVEKTIQIKRYKASLDNLLLTNYLEFRWYVRGEFRKSASGGSLEGNRQISRDREGLGKVAELLKEFLSLTSEPIGQANELAQRLARCARGIRDILSATYLNHKLSEEIANLFETLQRDLIQNLVFHSEKSDESKSPRFADIFAQCLAYGLFTARCNHSRGMFRLESAAKEIPTTNPFLRDLFHFVTRPGFDDEPFAAYVHDLVQLLNNTDIASVLADFGKRKRGQDPIIHFYETFLSNFDPAERERRGVYYTPEPVVSYIVRSVDQILKDKFGCREGLADKSRIGSGAGASHRVLILDPACGTGSFLYGVVDHIREEFAKSHNAGQWSDYVTEHLVPRLFGFELLMAPYAIAHLKLEMQLEARDMPEEARRTWACNLSNIERLRVYLTDTLEPTHAIDQTGMLGATFLAKEVNAAADVKSKIPIMVVLGNPPYSGHSAKPSKEWIKDAKTGKLHKGLNWIGKLVEEYRTIRVPKEDEKIAAQKYGIVFKEGGLGWLDEKNPKWLQNDYVKFIRFGEWRIEQSGAGILAFITDNSYLDSPTFRLMRYRLMQTFDEIYILNLHGNAKKKERCPDGTKDVNVFDITQGVAIAMFVRKANIPIAMKGKRDANAVIRYADLWGLRQGKDKWLTANDLRSTDWQTLKPDSPFFLFMPQDTALRAEYYSYPSITDLFPKSSVGIVTARDDLTIAFTKEELIERLQEFVRLSPEKAREKFELGKDVRDWKVEWAQNDLKQQKKWADKVVPILYRPFDIRYTVYTGKSRGFHCMPRPEVMDQMMDGANLGLAFVKREERSIEYDQVFVSNMISEHSLASIKTISYIAPLFFRREETGATHTIKTQYNFPAIFPLLLSGRLMSLFGDVESTQKESNGKGVISTGVGFKTFPIVGFRLMGYSYSILNSIKYRNRYTEFLKQDFPRIPLPPEPYRNYKAKRALALKLSELGQELIDLHILRSELLHDTGVSYPVPGSHSVERGFPKYYAPRERHPVTGEALEEGRVFINREAPSLNPPRKPGGREGARGGQYFDGIPAEVWNFHIGGYQVLDHWLRKRQGRTLSNDDIEHFKKVVKALAETIRIMREIDEAIPGWPLP